MPKIACIGWGSLIWDKERPFPIIGEWQSDGPRLPVEFVRRSKNGRITLVLLEGGPPVQTCWALLDVPNLATAAIALATREAMPSTKRIGFWPGPTDAHAPTIEGWAKAKQLDGVVWTALPPKWECEDWRAPTRAELLDYLGRLTGETREEAERYVRRAPAAIRTPYRDAIERELGWLPQPAE